MDFVKELVPTVATALAALASLVGVAVAVDQFTLRARMRRVVAWTNELLDVEEDVHRRGALVRIRDLAAASMVASVLVPARHVAEGLVWLMVGGYVVVQGFVLHQGVGDALATLVAAYFASIFGIVRAVRMYVERERVKAEYLDAVDVVPPRTDMLAKAEGGTRAEFGWAALLLAGVLGVTSGIGWLFSGERTFWPVGVVIVAISVLSSAVTGVRSLGRRARLVPTLAGKQAVRTVR